jgi:hypothetical protein
LLKINDIRTKLLPYFTQGLLQTKKISILRMWLQTKNLVYFSTPDLIKVFKLYVAEDNQRFLRQLLMNDTLMMRLGSDTIKFLFLNELQKSNPTFLEFILESRAMRYLTKDDKVFIIQKAYLRDNPFATDLLKKMPDYNAIVEQTASNRLFFLVLLFEKDFKLFQHILTSKESTRFRNNMHQLVAYYLTDGKFIDGQVVLFPEEERKHNREHLVILLGSYLLTLSDLEHLTQFFYVNPPYYLLDETSRYFLEMVAIDLKFYAERGEKNMQIIQNCYQEATRLGLLDNFFEVTVLMDH